MADSELCLGLHVSLLTANWHPAQTHKVHHPDPPVTACTVRLPSVCVVTRSRTLLESRGSERRGGDRDASLLQSVSFSDDVLHLSAPSDVDTETDQKGLGPVLLNS
ncbi:unnamed protein product [Pleuronectes platessa]|uniref:Uncharacterized protein n=1 Tax=Pleuronectes platessa TaxID=8262 RepID=A0A9N7VFS3_PLEPL|nr:unnamed protein product [Pleuronectes platessa]